MKTMILSTCFAGALAALTLAAQTMAAQTMAAQTMAPQTMAPQTMEGVVYDAATGFPLPGVAVSNGPTGSASRTDASGHFHLPLPVGYAPYVMAFKPGYLQANQTAPNNKPETLAQMRIDLKPEAVITGTVADEDGFPAASAWVQAMRYRMIDGQRTLSSAAQATADDRGQFRMDGLPAGRYFIRVYAQTAYNWDHRYATQYLGGSLQPDEKHVVEVKAGEAHKLDIQLARFEGVTVTGRVDGVQTDRSGMLPMIALHPSPQSVADLWASTGRSQGQTTFTIRHVPPGTYTLRLGQPNARVGDLTAELPLEVGDHDVNGLVLTAQPAQGVDVEGQIAMREGGTPGPWTVSVQSPYGRGATAHTSDDGSFVLKGLLPDHYTVQALPDRSKNPKLNGHVVSIQFGDGEVQQRGFDLDSAGGKPLRIHASTRNVSITGTIVDGQGVPLANATVYLQASQPAQQGFATTDAQGHFRAVMTDAGDYRVYVSTDLDAASLQTDDPFLKAHSGDFPVIHAAYGDNPPVRLVRNPSPAQ
jgi:protocatechuate 3,4-dioxygenase beta subunit